MYSLRSLVSPKKMLQINEGLYFCYSQVKLVQMAQKMKIVRRMYDTIFFTNLGPLKLIMMLYQFLYKNMVLLLTLYGIGLRNHGMTFLRPLGHTSKYRLKVKYSIKVSSSFESPAHDLEASIRFLYSVI